MEKVISKLSNEELDLVVGGSVATFAQGFKGTYTGLEGGDASFAGVLGKIVAFGAVAVPVGALMSLATAVAGYFAISKKGNKSEIQ